MSTKHDWLSSSGLLKAEAAHRELERKSRMKRGTGRFGNQGFSLGLEYDYIFGLRTVKSIGPRWQVWHRHTGEVIHSIKPSKNTLGFDFSEKVCSDACYRANGLEPDAVSLETIAEIDNTP